MSRAALVALALALGALAPPALAGDAAVEGCDPSLPATNVTFAGATWQLCGATAASADSFARGLAEASGFIENTTKALEQAPPTTILDLWQAYEDQRSNQNGSALAWRDPADALQASNVTVAGGSWDAVRGEVERSLDAPRQVAQQRTEADLLQRSAWTVQSARIAWAALALLWIAGGLLLGALGALPAMLQVQRKAAYWGAFSNQKDVERRQALLSWGGVALLGLGAALGAVGFVLRGGP